MQPSAAYFLMKQCYLPDDSNASGTQDDSSDESSDFDWEIEQVLCEVK
jgi:hypothetical protein